MGRDCDIRGALAPVIFARADRSHKRAALFAAGFRRAISQGSAKSAQRARISAARAQSSDICGKRSYDRPCVRAAPARLRDQELFSVLANRYFRTEAIERRIRTDSDLDTFNVTAVIARLANDLRKLTLMNAGRGRGLGDREGRADRQRQSNKCQLRPSRHLFLLFEKSA